MFFDKDNLCLYGDKIGQQGNIRIRMLYPLLVD